MSPKANEESLLAIAKNMQRLAEAATAGPWYREERGGLRITICPPEDIGAEKMVERVVEFPLAAGRTGIDKFLDRAANAAFIAASRTNAPLLADAVIEMVAKLRTECYCTGYGEGPCDICEFLAKLGVTPTTEGG